LIGCKMSINKIQEEVMNAKLEVNGLSKDYPDNVTDLEKLLVFFLENEKDEKEIIIEVKVDNNIYSEKCENEAREVKLDDCKRIEILTQDISIFAKNFLIDSPNYIKRLKNGFIECINHLKMPQDEENGYNILSRCLETLHAVLLHMDNVLRVLGEDCIVSKDYIKDLHPVVDKILRAQEDMDTILVAELIETQMVVFLDKWLKSLELNEIPSTPETAISS